MLPADSAGVVVTVSSGPTGSLARVDSGYFWFALFRRPLPSAVGCSRLQSLASPSLCCRLQSLAGCSRVALRSHGFHQRNERR